MATTIIQSPRTIESPGVQIVETDLTARSSDRDLVPTAVVTGFASQGPTDEIVSIKSTSEFQNIFGLPQNAAERYLWHTVDQLLASGPEVKVTRLPYGENGGDGSQNYYSALLFPVLPHGTDLSTASAYYILPPKSILISDGEYETYIKENNVNWNSSVGYVSSLNAQTFTLNRDVASSIFIDIVTELNINDPVDLANIATWTAPGWYTPTIPNTNQHYLTRSLSDYDINDIFIDRLTDYIKLNVNNKTGLTNQLEKYQGAPTVWVDKFNTDFATIVNNTTTYVKYVSGGIPTAPISYDLKYHSLRSAESFTVNNLEDIHKAGIVVVNKDKLGVNELYEGFYVGLTDNSDDTPTTNFESITAVKAVNNVKENTGSGGSTVYTQDFISVPQNRLSFPLTEPYSSSSFSSISERISRYPSYDFSTSEYDDCVKLFLFKLNTSANLPDGITLNYSTAEAYVGSLNNKRTQTDSKGGKLVAFNLETKLENNESSRIRLAINPNISQSNDWTDINGKAIKKVRIADGTKALWSAGSYIQTTATRDKKIGNLELKIDRALKMYELTENENSNIDVVCEAGLGTINAGTKAAELSLASFDGSFDDTVSVDTLNLKTVPKNEAYYDVPDILRDSYSRVVNVFRNFAQSRKNHVFIADPLRYIFVQGRNSRVDSKKAFDFATDIFTPLRNLYGNVEGSSYMTVYANWIRKYDNASDQFVWLPSSGFAGRAHFHAKNFRPWTAPAGFNYGKLHGVKELAINPNQRQRDILYRNFFNPIVDYPRDGIAIYGQKTFSRTESAFDRLNVRNLFLHLEKQVSNTLNQFVFEPNTIPTRNRVVLRLTPYFEAAKRYEGLYDYRLICDERNNTSEVIDNNELRLAVYIQPVRSAEFILADFVATRTGTDLDELVGN
jgi:hypothetical protein